MSIKSKLKFDLAVKNLLQEFAVMLVFISMIYKQSAISFILYLVLVWYTVMKYWGNNPLALVRYTIVVVILIQYSLALSNLSSYNSPSSFPSPLLQEIIPDFINEQPIDRSLYQVMPVYPS